MRKQLITGIILMAVIIVFITVYWAYEPERQAAAQREQFVTTMERGARGFVTTGCAMCHGVNGGGLEGDGPNLNDTELPEDTIIKTIERGVLDTDMSAWSVEDDGPLKKHEILDITTFITNWDSDLLDGIWGELGPELDIPLSPELRMALSEALEAVRNEELFQANLNLGEALSVAELTIQRHHIEMIIEEVASNNLLEAAELLEAMIGEEGEGDGHAHTH